jgi:prevent-host-death family protein
MTELQVTTETVTLAEAEPDLFALIVEVEAGSEITITGHGRPVARIVGVRAKVKRVAGDWGWTGTYDPAALAPMTDDEAREEGWPV